MDRFRIAEEAEATTRRESLNDWEFSTGNQWPPDIETARAVDSRPCLTMDHVQPSIAQVANEQRQQRPSGQVNPVGSGSDVETAEILEGMVRHIENISDAEIVYDTAFEHMLRGGFGWWRIVTDYVDDKSWNQEIKLKWVKNPFTVHMDPFANEPDYSDAEWAFLWDDLSMDAYKRQYPDSQVANIDGVGNLGDIPPDWMGDDSVRVAEYFHVEWEPHKLYLYGDGSTGFDDDPAPEGQQPVRERIIQRRKVMWSKINAVEILQQTEWLGKWIPLIPVNGVDVIVNGKRYLAGLVRNAKDPQRMYNYWSSAATEAIALAPKAPWIVAEGQISGYETQWEQSNRRNMATLTYKAVDVQGKPAPPPQRNAVEPPIQAMVLMLRQAGDDFRQATGIFPPALGDNPKDQSGKAIQLLQRRSDVGNVNWTDNLSRSIRHSTRALLDLIPHIYDAPRVQRIINPDNSVQHVGVFNSTKLPPGVTPEMAKMQLQQQGIEKVYDVGVGTYDVVVSVGPSFQTKRQEAVSSIMSLVQAYPPLMQAAGDILVNNMDWPQADVIADRLKKLLPPALQAGEDGQATPEQLQAQLAQSAQQAQLLGAALQQAQQIIQTKQVEAQNKLQIEALSGQKDLLEKQIDSETKIAVAEISTKAQVMNERIAALEALMQQFHTQAHEVAMQADQQAHTQDMAAQQAAQQQQMAQQQGQPQ